MDMNESGPILKGENLEVKMGDAVILNVPSILINEGEVLALIGPNGAGKTTLLHTLSYLLKPFTGEIFFRGKKVESNHSILEYRRRLAMVFQEPLLFDTTVFNNVASGLRIRAMEKRKIHDRVMEELDRFGIRHLKDRSAKTLSGGEAQRTSLSRAFALKPEILLLDEPFASLDPLTRDCLIEDLRHIFQQTRTTAIFATHDRTEALRLSDRIGVMNRGRILQLGYPDEVMNQPVDEFVASFVGIETILKGVVIKRHEGTFIASVGGYEIEAIGEVELGETLNLCIRPENVTISKDVISGRTSARNIFHGKVEKIAPLGLYQRVYINCGFPLVAFITNQSLKNLELKDKDEIVVSFKATAIHVIKRRG